MSQNPERPPRRSWTIRLCAALGLPLGLWCAGLIWFVASFEWVPADAQVRTDAIVVLTGGSGRIARGFDLLVAGRGRKLFISGVPAGFDAAVLRRTAASQSASEAQRQRAADLIACCVETGHAADNTEGNARETAAWLRREGFSSLRLVTADYHMRRSLLEFRRVLPPATTIVPAPVAQPLPLWRWRGGWRPVMVEYMKYLAALARPWLPPVKARSS